MIRWLCVILGLALVADAARADSIVVESYGETRPDEAEELMAPVIAELESRGFIGGSTLNETINERLSQRATVLGFDKVNEAKRFVASGRKQYVSANFDNAIKELSHALQILDSAPATLAKRQALRQDRFDTLVYLAMSHGRKGNQARATEHMAELIRSFPDKDVSMAVYGPDGRNLYRGVKKDIAQQGTGSLKIEVDDARTGVFLNERYVGGGSQTVSGLPAGRYRVYVQQGQISGRLHTVRVEPGSEASLSISWATDSALETLESRTWLAFESEPAREEHERSEALRIARAVGARGVVLLGLRDHQGRRSIVGQYLTVDSTRPVRSGVLSVDPVKPSPPKLRDLGKFLAGDESLADQFEQLANGGEEEGDGDITDPGGPRDTGGSSYGTWKWVTLLGGVAAAGTGVALIAIHEPEFITNEMGDTVRNPEARNTRTAGIVTAAVGGAIALSSIYFWVKDSGGSDASGTAVVPTSGGAMVTFTGRF